MAITNIIKTGGTSMNPILSANIDNIDFTNIPAGKIGTKESTFWNISTNTDVWKDGGDGTQWRPAVNAVDIDWNGAVVGTNKTLNTTGEVLSILQTAYNYATTYNVKYDDGKLYDDKGTEIKVGSQLSGATKTTLGGIKTKYHTTGNAAIVDTSSTTVTNRNYGIETDGAYLGFVKVPWTDTDTKVTSVDNHYKGSLGAKSSGLYKVAFDAAGHITGATSVVKSDITALGIPGSDTNTDTKVTSVDNHYKGSLGAKSSGLYKVAFDAAGHITSATPVTQNDIVTLIGDYFDSRYQKNKDVQISIPTSIVRTKSSTVTGITQSGGSISPKEIKVGKKSTITAPSSVTVTYALNNTTANVTISGADAVNQTPIVSSSNPNVIAVSGTTLTTKAEGKSTITVVCNGVTKEQEVSVSNASNTSKITSGWTYSSSNNCVTINGTQIEGKSAGTAAINVTYGGKSVSLGTLTVKSAVNYYWYVGNTSPEGMTPPSVGNANTTLCAWTDLGASLPTTSIKVYKADEVNYDDHTWYIAAPTAAGFVLYDAFNSEEELGYKKTKTFMIGDVSYDLWVRQSQGDQAFVWLHK